MRHPFDDAAHVARELRERGIPAESLQPTRWGAGVMAHKAFHMIDMDEGDGFPPTLLRDYLAEAARIAVLEVEGG